MKKSTLVITSLVLVILGAIISLFLLSSCELENHYKSQNTIYVVPGLNGGDLKVYEFDSCQWVGRLRGATDDVLTHRARCKYCEQRNKK